jgi:hypothetical protein
LFFNGSHGTQVVVVRLRGKQQFNITQAKTKCFNISLDLCGRRSQSGVDEDVALAGGDEVAAQVVGAYVIQIACNAERRIGL